jgi:hypothetical protein
MREGLAGARFQGHIILAPGQCAFRARLYKVVSCRRIHISEPNNFDCPRARHDRWAPAATRAGTMTGGQQETMPRETWRGWFVTRLAANHSYRRRPDPNQPDLV